MSDNANVPMEGASAEVLLSLRKASDLELHIRKVTVDGASVVEFRDYITSLGEYGRGYWFPGDSATVAQVAQRLLMLATGG